MAEPWMTTHSVLAVGGPLLVKGATQLGPGERIEAHLRADGADDVVLAADPDRITIDLAAPEGPATLETGAAARVLLLCGAGPPIRHAFAAASDRRLWDACAACSAVTEPLRAKRSAQKLLQVTATWLMSS